jgi:short-subunit dehydrogenase
MKNILITGASSGIGRGLALLYAGQGIRLLLTGRDIARLNAVAELCRAKGATVDICPVCVTERAAFEKEILSWDDKHPIDLVIANAGISGGAGTNEQAFRDIMEINLTGTFNTVNPLIPRMIERQAGHIVLMSSIAGFRGMPNAPAYSVSKVAVRAYGEALRPLLKAKGVRLSVICPGFIKTPLTDTNPFPMPFLMTVEEAALRIKKGIDANKARIAFPWPMYLIARSIALLPLGIGDFILSKTPKKT